MCQMCKINTATIPSSPAGCPTGRKKKEEEDHQLHSNRMPRSNKYLYCYWISMEYTKKPIRRILSSCRGDNYEITNLWYFPFIFSLCHLDYTLSVFHFANKIEMRSSNSFF